MTDLTHSTRTPFASALVLTTVFVVATCGLVYELVAGTLASYLLGDSVTQFSIVIGLFLTAMGLGSWASRFIRDHLVAWFVGVEIAVGLLGGLSALLGYAAFTFSSHYVPVLVATSVGIGILVGLEIPLVVRILQATRALRITVANVFAVDYLGALAACLLFPFVLLPHLGLVQASLVVGLANLAVALILIRGLRDALGGVRGSLQVAAAAGVLVLALATAFADTLVHGFENRIYQDEVILARDTAHQRLVVTKWRDDVRLYLNGHLQFSTVDEYRYHEALAWPALELAARRERVLILGGGDGLLARQVLRADGVQRIDLVDLDPGVTTLFRDHSLLSALNDGALRDPRVHIHNADAMRFLEGGTDRWDVVLIDLPDPTEPALAKLYSTAFYRLLARRVAADGAVATQATSPFRSRQAFWCIVETLRAGLRDPTDGGPWHVAAYHTVVPTFGTWGFAVARPLPVRPATIEVPPQARYLTSDSLPGLFTFSADTGPVDVPVNHLDDPVLARLYREGYHRYLQ